MLERMDNVAVIRGRDVSVAGRLLGAWCALLVVGGFVPLSVPAGLISVPNASFEAPDTVYATPIVAAWQHTPQPEWYDDQGVFLWSQLTGVFSNQPPPDPSYIDNCDGDQGCWLFAVPEVGLFQDYDSIGGTNTSPTHAFDAVYAVGSAYRLTVGLIGGGGSMAEGVSLRLGFYYRDHASNRVSFATTNVTHSLARFPTTTQFVDVSLSLPPVVSSDAWAGRHIGIEFLSTVSTNLQGGYWDLDNVRLEEWGLPELTSPERVGDQFGFTLVSEPGLRFEVLASAEMGRPLEEWASLGILTNAGGEVPFLDPSPVGGQRYYMARQLP